MTPRQAIEGIVELGLPLQQVRGATLALLQTHPGAKVRRVRFARSTKKTLELARREALHLNCLREGADFQLQVNADLATTNWVNVTNTPVVANGKLTVTNAISSNAFFRLKQ